MKTTRWSDEKVVEHKDVIDGLTRYWGKKKLAGGHYMIRQRTFMSEDPACFMPPVTREEMRFGIWLGAWDLTAAEHTTPEQFREWVEFHETRIYRPKLDFDPDVCDAEVG